MKVDVTGYEPTSSLRVESVNTMTPPLGDSFIKGIHFRLNYTINCPPDSIDYTVLNAGMEMLEVDNCVLNG